MVFGGTAILASLVPSWGHVQQPAQGSSPQVALVPVHYGTLEGQPLIAPHLDALGSAIERQWNGTVWAQTQVSDAVHTAWLFAPDRAPLEDFTQGVKKAQALFTEKGSEAAIPVLERLVEESEGLLPQISTRPPEALLMLQAHLLLWWSLEQAGERGRLVPLMQKAVRRFPAAQVTTRQWPPAVAEAFAVARQVLLMEQASINFRLRGAPQGGCTVLVNGFEHGDGHSGGLGVAGGQPYYISARCEGVLLRPRRVIATSNIELELDVELTQRLTQTSAGPVLRIEGGPGAVGELVRLSGGLGRVLGSSDVVLAGGFEEGGRTVLQLDRVDVAAAKRVCSVRLETEGMEPWAIDKAIRVLVVRKPTASAPVVFASEDGVYRSVDQYVDWAATDVSYTWTWTMAGLTVASLGTGLVFESLARASRDELTACITNTDCQGTVQVGALTQDTERHLDLRNAFLIGAGASAAAALLAFLLERQQGADVLAPDPADTTRAQIFITPWFQPGATGLNLSLSLD